MHAVDEAAGHERAHELVHGARVGRVGARWHPAVETVDDGGPLGPAQLVRRLAEHDDARPAGECGGRGTVVEVVDDPEDTDDGRRIDVVAEGLVVEADVPADDRDGEGGAGLAHALDHLGELPHHLGVLGVAEVQAVDQGDGPGADAGDVARRLEHGEPPAGAGVETAEPSLAVGGKGQGAVRPLQPQHGGVGAGPGDRVEEQLVVVLAPHPRLVGDRRRGEQCEQLAREVCAGGETGGELGRRVGRLERVLSRGPGSGPVVHGAVAEALDGDVGERLGVNGAVAATVLVEHAVVDAEPPVLGHPTDHGCVDLPARAQP